MSEPRENAEDLLGRTWAEHEAQPWKAEITYSGWGFWVLDITKGMMGFLEPPWAFGTRKHAEKVARRKLARLRRQDERKANARTVL